MHLKVYMYFWNESKNLGPLVYLLYIKVQYIEIFECGYFILIKGSILNNKC
jgi:hypothetical protein